MTGMALLETNRHACGYGIWLVIEDGNLSLQLHSRLSWTVIFLHLEEIMKSKLKTSDIWLVTDISGNRNWSLHTVLNQDLNLSTSFLFQRGCECFPFPLPSFKEGCCYWNMCDSRSHVNKQIDYWQQDKTHFKSFLLFFNP